MKRWLAAAAALLIVLSGCAGHLASSSGSESLPEESSSSSGPEAIPELPVEDSFGETAYYWTDDADRVSQLWELQHRETLTEEEALTLAEDLTEKAHYLNYLTYGEGVYREEGLVSIIRWDTDSTDGVPEKVEILSPDGRYTQEFLLVHHLPYSSVGEMRQDLLTVFEPQAADLSHFFYDPETGYGMYWDLNDHLYVLGSVGSVARPFQWDFETAEIVEQAEDRIAIEADASLVESWRDTLVLVREDGIWRLTDSHYAQQE